MYGFYDFENILDDEGNQGQTANGEIHTYLWKTGASLFTKVYNSQSPNFKETNQFIGLGYTDLKGDGWWFKPRLLVSILPRTVILAQLMILMDSMVSQLDGTLVMLSIFSTGTSYCPIGMK